MHPILVTFPQFSLFGHAIGPLNIFSYGAMLALAFMLSIALTAFEARRSGYSADDILDLAVWVILSSIFMSRVLYVITGWNEYREHTIDALKIYQGGLSFHGGVIGGALAVIVFCRVKKISIFGLGDNIMPALSLGLATGRIGCFLNGCCYGRPTHEPWGIVFPVLRDGIHRHPAQLYDSAMNLAMVFLLIGPLKKLKRKDGDLFAFWLILSGITRFIMEIFRSGVSSVVTSSGITLAQWLCIAMIIGGVFLWKFKMPEIKPASAVAAQAKAKTKKSPKKNSSSKSGGKKKK